MELIILTGSYGAGKSTAASAFEEIGYTIVENIPQSIISNTFDAFLSEPSLYEKTVINTPIDTALNAYRIAKKNKNIKVFLLVLDASKEEILTRYKLTRHVHPLQAKGHSLANAIEHDKKNVILVKPNADLYIDTTGYSSNELRSAVFTKFNGQDKGLLTLTILSFGYKYGAPDDAELIFDSRILDNPFWVDSLKHLTGNDQPVKDFVLKSPQKDNLLNSIYSYLDFYLPLIKSKGRNFYTIAIGCSGGQHRSVTIANEVAKHYLSKYQVILIHRDLGRFKN